MSTRAATTNNVPIAHTPEASHVPVRALTLVPSARPVGCWSVVFGIIYALVGSLEALSGCYSIVPGRIDGERLGIVTGYVPSGIETPLSRHCSARSNGQFERRGRRGAAKQRSTTVNHGAPRTTKPTACQP